MVPIQTVVIGAWTWRAIQRSRENLLDVMSHYASARKALSVYDLAEWQYLLKNFKVRGRNFMTTDLEQLFSADGALSEEFKNSIIPLSVDQETVTAVEFRLSKDAQSDNNMDGYQFIHIGNLCLVVIPEGFEHNKTIQPSYETEFIRAWVKALYEKLPLHSVSQYPVFRAFLEQFKF